MGISIDWFLVNADYVGDFKKSWKHLDKIETNLYTKYKEKMDTDMERLDREMEEVYSHKRSIKLVKDFSLHRLVSFEDFDEWFDAYRKNQSYKQLARLVELPQLDMTDAYWVVQWVLNRNRGNLKLAPKTNELKPKNNDWDFVLTLNDLADFKVRMETVKKNPKLAHKMFPIYDDLYFGNLRKKDSRDVHSIVSGSKFYATHIKYAMTNILRNWRGNDALLMSVNI